MAAPLQRITQPPTSQIAQMENVSVGLTNLQGFELAQRAAKLMASSTLVPKDYQGNLANCVIALNMAQRIGADPLMTMQNLIVVHGRPTWSAQFLIATFNSCGRFSAIRYEFFGDPKDDSWGCRAVATELSTGEKLVGTDVSIKIAKDEGWYERNGSKWKTMPQQMLQYRAASWFVRTIAPELSMGLHTAEEIHDTFDAVPNESGSYVVLEEGRINPDIVDPDTGEIVTEDDIARKKREIAELIESKRAADKAAKEKEKREAIDTSTGEILDEKMSQAVSMDDGELDPYLDLRLALEDCNSLSDVGRLFQSLDPAAKKDETIRSIVRAREDQIKVEKGLA